MKSLFPKKWVFRGILASKALGCSGEVCCYVVGRARLATGFSFSSSISMYAAV